MNKGALIELFERSTVFWGKEDNKACTMRSPRPCSPPGFIECCTCCFGTRPDVLLLIVWIHNDEGIQAHTSSCWGSRQTLAFVYMYSVVDDGCQCFIYMYIHIENYFS